MKKCHILDTCVLLTDPNCFYNFKTSDLVLPFGVLQELDKKKNVDGIIGANARSCIRTLDSLRQKNNLADGVRIAKGKGLLFILGIDNVDIKTDMQIISVAKLLQEKYQKVIVVSKDLNVRVRADSMRVEAIDYELNKTVDKREHLYSGFATVNVDDQLIDRFYNKEPIFLQKNGIKLYYNEFLMLTSIQNNSKTAIARFQGYNNPLKRVSDFKQGLFSIKPKNKEQQFSMDLLMDKNVPVVSLSGIAGSGKTLVSLAAGLQQTIGENPLYNRLIVMRPVSSVGMPLGYLPGSLQEKLEPTLQPIVDNLRYLLGDDKVMLEEYISKGIIEIEALSYIRGRTLSNAFIIFDETQNTTLHEMKTVATRVGQNTKIVVTGDLMQIDNFYINEITSGLTGLIEKLKGQELFGHITLTKGERSAVATMASKLL